MRPAMAAILGVVVGLALGLWLGWGASGPEGSDGPLEGVLESELESERAQGDALRRRVEALEAQLAAAATAPVAASGPPQPALVAAVAEPGEAAAESETETIEPATTAGAFADDRLTALGYHPADVERLRRAWEGIELERLYLQNARARSNTNDGDHWMKMMALEQSAIEELGDSDYDAMLYAAGNRNRVRVSRVFPESPADEAGLRDGDEIIGWDDRPMYRVATLKGETMRCQLGTTASLTLLRGGAERRVWVPCGPLGVQLELVNAPPR